MTGDLEKDRDGGGAAGEADLAWLGDPSWRGRTVAVVGLGRSGLAVARELHDRGARLLLSDSRPASALAPIVEACMAGATPSEPPAPWKVFGGGHPPESMAGADLVVLSPGVSVDAPVARAARGLGVPVVGELELGWRLAARLPFVAITGTNGKTTTTSLVGALLAASGLRAPVGGNIGTPLVSLVHAPADACVVEVSSFQLETVHGFRPRVGLLLNLTDDHLDRHGTRERYLAVKARLFARQGPGDWAVLNADDPLVAALAPGLEGRVLMFGREDVRGTASAARPPDRVFVEDGWIVARLDGEARRILPVEEIRLHGAHNLENVLAAVAAAVALGLPPEKIRKAVAAFEAVEHRIEPVGVHGGVQWINDSKGTNYASTVRAVEAFREPLVLIAGGRDKGGDLAPLVEAIAARVRHVVLIGEAADRFEGALREAGYGAIIRAPDLPGAVAAAGRLARAGEVVLFSPACTSFDMFQNYEERGRAYRTCVRSLAEQPARQAP